MDPFPAEDEEVGGGGLSPAAGRWLRILALLLPGVILLGAAVVLGSDDDSGDVEENVASQQQVDGGTTADSAGAPTEAPAQQASWNPTPTGRPSALGPIGLPAGDVPDGAPPGVYLWSDFGGWHLWVVGGEGVPEEIRGHITSDGDLQPGRLAAEDAGSVETDGRTIIFSLPTDRPAAGIDFDLWFFAESVSFVVTDTEGRPLPLPIRLGAGAHEHPMPLEVRKG